MKKIAINSVTPIDFFNSSKRGGGEILFENLIKQLIDNSDIQLFILYSKEFSLPDENKNLYPQIKFIEINESPYSDEYIKAANKIVQDENIDLLINANMHNLFGTTMLQCHSYIHRLNKAIPIIKPIKKFFSNKKILWQKEIYKNANKHKFIAVSQIIKNDYSKNFNIAPQNIFVAYPGCKQQKENINISDIKQKKDITLGAIANSSINKGGHIFLFTCGLLKLSGCNFKIKIVAPKYNKDILMKFIIYLFNMRKQTEVLPFQKDLTSFYEDIDVLVVPSLNEAFGLVTLEAMSFAKPVIVSSTAGSSEIINTDNGFVYNRHSLSEFIKAMKNVINLYNNHFEEYQKYSLRAFETSKIYTWKKFADEIIKII